LIGEEPLIDEKTRRETPVLSAPRPLKILQSMHEHQCPRAVSTFSSRTRVKVAGLLDEINRLLGDQLRPIQGASPANVGTSVCSATRRAAPVATTAVLSAKSATAAATNGSRALLPASDRRRWEGGIMAQAVGVVRYPHRRHDLMMRCRNSASE